MLAHHGEHLGRGHVAEPGPAQLLVGAAPRVGPLGDGAPGQGISGTGGLALLRRLQLVQAANEQQIR